MSSYAFWNNKGGVGKSFLAFAVGCELAKTRPEEDVYVLDLCPQANVSEMLLGGSEDGAKAIRTLTRKRPRSTISGYLDARLNSPFTPLASVEPYVCLPYRFNEKIPRNLALVCGDNLLEIQSEAIRQTSQLSVPADSWARVIKWVHDLVGQLRVMSGDRDTVFLIDCNPSFAVFTQLAVIAAEHVVVPFTADDSSRRGVENVVALLYGIGDQDAQAYSKLSFAKRAKEENVELPKLHTFISNRVTKYRGRPSSAFEAMIKTMKKTMDTIHKDHRGFFSSPREKPSSSFLFVPDYHSVCVIASTTGSPLHALKAGPRIIHHERMQLNKPQLDDYRNKLIQVVKRL